MVTFIMSEKVEEGALNSMLPNSFNILNSPFILLYHENYTSLMHFSQRLNYFSEVLKALLK